MVAVVAFVTALVVILNVPVEEPAATVKEVATVAEVDEEVTATVTALLFGTALRVTVPVDVAPPISVEGDRESAVIANGVTESVAVFDVPPYVAVIVMEIFAVTTT